MTTHRRMIDNLCRQALDEGQAVTHREDLLAAEVRRLQGENDRLRAQADAIEAEALAMDDLASDMGLPGRSEALRLCARSIRAAMASGDEMPLPEAAS